MLHNFDSLQTCSGRCRYDKKLTARAIFIFVFSSVLLAARETGEWLVQGKFSLFIGRPPLFYSPARGKHAA